MNEAIWWKFSSTSEKYSNHDFFLYLLSFSLPDVDDLRNFLCMLIVYCIINIVNEIQFFSLPFVFCRCIWEYYNDRYLVWNENLKKYLFLIETLKREGSEDEEEISRLFYCGEFNEICKNRDSNLDCFRLVITLLFELFHGYFNLFASRN